MNMLKYMIIGLFLLGFVSPVCASDAGTPLRTVVYFFHPNYKSFINDKMLRMTNETVQQRFDKELNEYILEFKSIDSTAPENKDLCDKYKIGYSGNRVFLSRQYDLKEIRHRELTDIWKLSKDEIAYKNYVSDELKSFMKEKDIYSKAPQKLTYEKKALMP